MKNILITGASSGIGKGLAIYYAQNNAQNIFICGRNKERTLETEKLCKKFCKNVFSKILDVTNREETKKWIEECNQKAELDLVFANAGVGTCDDSIEATYQTFDININGVLNTVLPTISEYRKNNKVNQAYINQTSTRNISSNGFSTKNGSKTRNTEAERTLKIREHSSNGFCNQTSTKTIAIVSSIAGYHGLSTCPDYSATKACVKAWGEALRVKLKSEHIQVNIVCPGFVKSNITDKNTCAMPGIIDIDEAAKKIAIGIKKNKPIIAFPWYLRFSTWILSILPNSLSDYIYAILPKKA